MSILMMSRVWAEAPFEKTTLLVLLALADQARDDGTCWPSVSTVAAKARCTERYCRVILADLEEKGWLMRVHRAGASNRYRVVIPTENISPENISVLSPSSGESCTGAQDSPELGIRETINEPSIEPSLLSAPIAIGDEVGKRRRAKASTAIPADFSVTPEMVTWARANTPMVDGRIETEKFRAYHQAKGTRFKDWTAAWRNWMLNAVRFAGGPALPVRPVPPGDGPRIVDGKVQSVCGIDYEALGEL